MKNSIIILVFFIPFLTKAQELPQGPTLQDYNRAVSYLWSNLVNKKVFNANIQPIWLSDSLGKSQGLAFITQDKNKKVFNRLIFSNNRIEPLFDHIRVAQLLTDSLKTPINATDLPIQGLVYKNLNHIEFNLRGTAYELNLEKYQLTKKTPADRNILESKSPDGKWLAYTDQYNLYVKSTTDGTKKQLSKSGVRHYEYGTYYGWSDIIDGENGERPQRLFVHWSPDSKWIQTYITDMRNAKKMYLLDWSIDSLYKPKLLSYYRGSPGDTDMVKMTPVFYNITTGQEIIKSQLPSTHTNPIGYEWSKEIGIIYQEIAQRGYQAVSMHRYNLNTNSDELLYHETSSTNIDNYESRIIEPWGKVLITSERDGWRQLYLLDLKSKQLQSLTGGAYYINDIVHIDTIQKTILFTASGKEPGRNPYHQHLYRIRLESKQVELLTPEDANHDVAIAPDGLFIVDNISTLQSPTKTVLKALHKNPMMAMELCRADITGLDSLDYKAPISFTTIGRDGHTTLYGAIWKPSRFDASKKYPVIDQSYTGPHTYMYPRNFVSSIARSNQALAELGFIVITVDGMGTANRSKAFHNVSYKNMGKNLEDHRSAILQLARKYTWVDSTRVGIFGHSAGGYDAGHAVLEYPDFYKVAVASSADHDFRMEKDWWPEMYMGWPVDSTYHQVSNITMAGNLKGKLLITHGGIDENVNPSATFKLAEALIRANKEFDMLILPSQRHGYQGAYNEYFTKKKWNYFVEHLLGAKPIWNIALK